MFHLLGYTTTFAGAATLQDMTAAVDGQFSQRNGHYILTEPYSLLAAQGTGALNLAFEFRIPSVNAIAPWNIFPPNLAVTQQANPNIDDYRAFKPTLPQMEEIQVLASASGAEQENMFLWLGSPQWSTDLSLVSGGLRRLTILATAAPTKVANAWSADANLVFEQSLKGGVYAIIGATVQATGCLAFRINFPRSKLNNGRKMLPGDSTIQSYGNQPNWRMRTWLGIWGFFHTFEPPLIEVWGNAAGAVTATCWLDVVYMGGDESTLTQFYGALAA